MSKILGIELNRLNPEGATCTPESLNRFCNKKVLIINAHPDDESFGFGGFIALIISVGAAVHIVSLTRGEAGESSIPLSRPLSEVREEEMRTAAHQLGVRSDNIDLLTLPDGQLTCHFAKLLEQLQAKVCQVNPDYIVTMHSDSTRHPDHVACTRAIHELLRQSKIPPVPVLLQYLPEKFEPKEGEKVFALDISAVLDTKISAINSHLTQSADAKRITPVLLDHEYFVEM